MCLYPVFIKNKKYTYNKKNKGNIPELKDDRCMYVPVGCGKCIECMKQKKRAWQVRLLEELKQDRNALFVTLTFSNESIHELYKLIIIKNLFWENEIATLAVRRFLERWRKEHKKSVKHLLITELGHENTERIHLHGIIWTNEPIETIERIWKYGHIWVGDYVNEKTVNYIVKYINKIDEVHKGYMPKILCSAGIGSGFLGRFDSKRNIYKENDTIEYYKTSDGSKINLPIYYRNKIYTEDEREKLWLAKLDKQERFICGQLVSVKDDENEYFRLLEHYRKLNKRIGYGDNSKDWSKANYQKKLYDLRKNTNYKNNLKNEIEKRSKRTRNKT